MKAETIERLEGEFDLFPVMSSGAPDADLWNDELARLDIRPAADYIEFIRLFGGSIVGSYTIVGVGVSPAMGREEASVSRFTETYRNDKWPGTEDWVVFSKDLGGNPIGMDKKGVVWSWDHDARIMVRMAESFEEFLEKFCFSLTT